MMPLYKPPQPNLLTNPLEMKSKMDLIRTDLRCQNSQCKEIDDIKIFFNQTVKRLRWTFAVYDSRYMLSLTVNQLIFVVICVVMNVQAYIPRGLFFIAMAIFIITGTILLASVIGAIGQKKLNRINNDIHDIKRKIDNALGKAC